MYTEQRAAAAPKMHIIGHGGDRSSARVGERRSKGWAAQKMRSMKGEGNRSAVPRVGKRRELGYEAAMMRGGGG